HNPSSISMAKQPKAGKPKNVTIDDLAGMVARGFEQTATKGDVARLEHKVDAGFAHVNARLDQVRRDIADLDDLRERVQAIEMRMGLGHKQ
ncbi:MAG: hypothetical protein Q8R13_01235, partial [bacterium]|nr:hypothetical protein [bacterium]